MAKAIIELKGVCKSYTDECTGTSVLKNIDLKIEQGEYATIMGRSGSGKSTLLHLMGCLDLPSKGKILIDGNDTSIMGNAELARIRREKIGFVFQSFYLLPTLTALQNVALPMMLTRLPNEERTKRATHILESLGLGHRLTHLPNQLSGGERQRVAIARALANSPSILLADEPTGNLDSRAGEDVLSIFDRLHKKENKTIVIVSHEKYVADRSERQIHIIDGEINTGSKKERILRG